jgi:hypothetical protein
MFLRKPPIVSVTQLPAVGMHVASTPSRSPAALVMLFMPELKQESPMPWATTIGSVAFCAPLQTPVSRNVDVRL